MRDRASPQQMIRVDPQGFGPDGKLSVLPIMDDVDSALKDYMGKRGMIAGK